MPGSPGVTSLPLPQAPLGVGRIPIWGPHKYQDVCRLRGELLQEDGWSEWRSAFLCKVSSREHYGALYLMLCPCTEVLCLAVAVTQSGWGIPAGVLLGLLRCRLCLAWVLPQGWVGLGLAYVGLNCCFPWEEEKAERAPLSGVQGEFSYMSCCMIVLRMIYCAKTCFSFTCVSTTHSLTKLTVSMLHSKE